MLAQLLLATLLAQPCDIVGTATDLSNGSVLYYECYRDDFQQVTYWDRQGAQFAEKNLSYDSPRWQPNLVFASDWAKQQDRLRVEGNTLFLDHKKGSESQSSEIEVSDFLLIDAGYHFFVLEHLQQLAAGRSFEVEFLAVTKARSYDFLIQKTALQDNILTLEVKPASRLISWFVAPLILQYNLTNGHLLRFEGITNIAGSDGKFLQARIDYQYIEKP